MKRIDEATTVQDRCPRCHAPNLCAVASGASACWCFGERTVGSAALAVSAEQQPGGREACLCRRCLREVSASESRTLHWKAGEHTVSLGLDEAGAGSSVVLLPAPSSICTREEMRGVLGGLASQFCVRSVDWPGFGDRPRPRADWSPAMLSAFLEWLLGEVLVPPHAIVAAGHAAGYALQLCAARPGLIRRLVLVAPTWRGPLPTMMGGQRPWFARVRALLDNAVAGPPLYRLNVSRAVVVHMAREHVYEEAGWLQGARLASKLALTRASGARHASVRFVSGALDPVASRAAFLELARRAGVPILQLYGAHTPVRSRAEMEALAQLPEVRTICLPHGRLAVHEEFAAEVASAAAAFLQER